LLIFGRNFTEKVSNKNMLYFSTSPGEMGNPDIAYFHLNAACCFYRKHKISSGHSWTTFNVKTINCMHQTGFRKGAHQPAVCYPHIFGNHVCSCQSQRLPHFPIVGGATQDFIQCMKQFIAKVAELFDLVDFMSSLQCPEKYCWFPLLSLSLFSLVRQLWSSFHSHCCQAQREIDKCIAGI